MSQSRILSVLLVFLLWHHTSIAQENSTEDYSVNTFYALLVAEMAGQRQLYDLALGNYLLESHRTQDPGVTARATQIAQFIGADQAALDAATLWVKLDENNPQAQQALSSELVKAARFSESVIHLQKALDLDPLLNVNFISTQGNDLTEGARELWLESLTPLAVQFSQNQALSFNIASLHQQQGNLAQAINICDRLVEHHPKYYPAWSLKARMLASDNQHQGALDTVNLALVQFESDKSLTLLKARLLIKLKDIKGAGEVFKQISEQNPDDPHILLPLALTQLDLENFLGAKASLTKLLGMHQLESEAHYYLGRIEEELNNPDAALEHYLAMTSGREYLSAQGAIVDLYLDKVQLDTALEHLKQQRNIDGENQEAYYLMEIDALNRSKLYPQSLETLNRAISLYPNNKEMRYARAIVAEKLDNFVQLEEDLMHIIELDPNNATALNALGYSLADRNIRIDEAHAYLVKALSIKPEDPAIIDSLGWVYFRMGKYEEALAMLHQAFEAFPDAEVAAHLGEVYYMKGDITKAKEIWQKALDKTPKSRILNDTLQRLNVEL